MTTAAPSGMLFENPGFSLEKLKDLTSLPIKEKQSKFIESLLFTFTDRKASLVDQKDLENSLKVFKLPASRQSINRYARELVDLGVFSDSFHVVDGIGGARRKYTLRMPREAQEKIDQLIEEGGIEGSRVRIASKSMQSHIEDGNKLYLSSVSNVKAVSDTLFMGIFDRCMRRSVKEKVKDNLINNRLNFQGEKVHIQTTCQSDSEIAAIEDQQVMRALLSLLIYQFDEQIAEQGITDPSEIENLWPVDLTDVAEIMEYKDKYATENIKRIFGAIQRLYATKFTINITDPENSEFVKFFDLGYGGFDLNSFQFISHLDMKLDTVPGGNQDDVNVIPRYVLISLGTHLWQRMIKHPSFKNVILRCHDELLPERQGLIHVMYNYFRAVLPPSKPNAEYNRSVEQTAKILMPSQSYSNFRIMLERAMKKFCLNWEDDTQTHTVKMYGYIYTLYENNDVPSGRKNRRPLWLKVVRDKNDYFLGDEAYKKRNPTQIELGM